jgi:5-formyltetrahydrofolate cyclo-ligase
MPDLTGLAEKSRIAKTALRGRLITHRRTLTPSDLTAAATLIQDQVLALVRLRAPAVVAAYLPVGSEPGGPGLPDLLAAHARVLLPVLLPDGDLNWAAYTGVLSEGPRGLREPAGPRLGPSAVAAADLVLVPALAVSRRGMRMGRGGGSYDRALARLADTSALVLALLHEGELLDEVPAEPHDQPVHGVIQPGGLTLSPGPEWTK